MTANELIERNRARANEAGRQRASADSTLAVEALGAAQGARDKAVKAAEDGLKRRQEVAWRISELDLELKNLRVILATEVCGSFDISQNRWNASTSDAIKKHVQRRQVLLAERDAASEVLSRMSDLLVIDGPRLHRATVAERQAELDYLNREADLKTIDVLIASAPLLALDKNMIVVSATGSEISNFATALAHAVIRLDEAKKELAAAEEQARIATERAA